MTYNLQPRPYVPITYSLQPNLCPLDTHVYLDYHGVINPPRAYLAVGTGFVLLFYLSSVYDPFQRKSIHYR